MKRIASYFTRLEMGLWGFSVGLILLASALFDQENLVPIASLVGVTSLILSAKGHYIGQALMILFSILYGVISHSFAYYGEMITYLGMTLPMSLLALISWLRHPYKGKRTQVQVNRITAREQPLMWLLTAAVTLAFYFILACFDTAHLIPSTLSVTTSFLAVYLTFRRSPYFALAYAANDVILIVLWILARDSSRRRRLDSIHRSVITYTVR